VTAPTVTDTATNETDDGDTGGHTGGMIALIPADDDAQNLAVDGGDDPNELHLTLVFLGDDVSDWDDSQRAQVMVAAQQIAATMGPVHARAFGHAQFNPDGGEDGTRDPCAVYLIGDTDQLGPARDALAGTTDQDQHSPFVPHVTAGTGVNPSDLSYTGPVTFDRMRVALGDQSTDIPLGGDNTMTAAAPTTPAPADAGATIVSDTGTEIRVHWPSLAVEGLDTGDGRYLTPGGGSHRTVPLSLLALPYSAHGGDDAPAAEVFGQITNLTRRPGPEVTSKRTGKPFPDGTYVWSADATIDGTHKFADLVRKGHLRGGSVDLSDLDAELIDDETAAMSENPRRRAVLTRYEIAAATMVPVPAFADAYCDVVDTLPPALAASALPADLAHDPVPMWRSPELDELDAFLARTPGGNVKASARKKAADAGHTLPGTDSFPIENGTDLTNAIKRAGSAKDPVKARKFIMSEAKRLKLTDKIPDNWNADGTITGGDSVAASAGTNSPPIEWFRDPQLDGPTIPPVVGDDGRIYGHVAAWASTHIGYQHRRVNPPRSQADYAYFHTGAARVVGDDGHLVTIPAGHIALDTGHAGMDADYLAATAHYDNTGSLVADVCAGEDAYGIWVAGAVCPGVDDLKVHKLRSCGLSGDWRRIGAGLEMVAAISVPTPGFPVPRARVASGVPLAMVAAGALVPELTRAGAMVDYNQLADVVADRVLSRQQHAATLAARRTAALAALDDNSDRMAELLAAIPDETAEFALLTEQVGEPTDEDLTFAALFCDTDVDAVSALKQNWVQKAGGLPSYIKRIKVHLQAKGMTESRAIATAVNVVKKACATGDLNFPGVQQENAGSKAEACAAVADWERKKAQSHAS
jgi:hypothetical protein